MLHTLTLLFAFQFLGEFLHGRLGVPVPGPVLGMVCMLVYLILRGQVSDPLKTHSGYLLKHLPLFFIPAGVGVMLYPELLAQQGIAIGASLIVGTLIAFVLTVLLIQALVGRKPERPHDEP